MNASASDAPRLQHRVPALTDMETGDEKISNEISM
jgi:hypothetical protein